MAVKKRLKPLRTTVGLDPTAPDFGNEADLVSVVNEAAPYIRPKRWTGAIHGFLRAPFRVGLGPESYIPDAANPTAIPDRDFQLHSPANLIVGVDNQRDWRSVGLNPTPLANLYFTAGNVWVSGTLIISAQTFYDTGYKKLKDMGTISQAYLTLKFAEAFGSKGGFAITAGAFSNRYGLAGPRQLSGGYYNTYLFGRTRVAGAAVTFNLDVNDRTELVFEGGGGAQQEVISWYPNPAGIPPGMTTLDPTPYLPPQGPTPQGSNFVWHGHGALLIDEWLKVAGHYLASYTPNDNWAALGAATVANPAGQRPPPSSSMHVLGADAHLDLPRFGSAYLGYSYVKADAVLSLASGIELLHSQNGYDLTRNYFNPAFAPISGTAYVPGTIHGDSGTLHTIQFQYLLRLAPLLQLPATGRDVSLAVFGMYNHVSSWALAGATNTEQGKQDKLKIGAELQVAPWRYVSGGVRFDHVRPDGPNADVVYSAISPRVAFRSAWFAREYILLSYTNYLLGDAYLVPFRQNEATHTYHKHLVVLSAFVAF
jgi:hypothetical protein